MAYRIGHEVSKKRTANKPSSINPKRKPSARFFMIAGSVAVIMAVLLLLLIQGPPTVSVEKASVVYTADFGMLIVRDEVVYQAKNYGKADFIAIEGAHVEKGEPVVKVYELGYNENTVSELLELRKTIIDYEINVSRSGVIDPQLEEIETRIGAKADEIEAVVSGGDSKSLLTLERQMRELLGEKVNYLASVVVPDNQLRKYISKESELSDTINGWTNLVNADTGGTVSFYFDGCEALMSKDNIGKFTKKTLEELLAGKTINSSGSGQKSTSLYRLVSEESWFVVLLSKKQVPEMFMGNTFSIIFDDYLDTRYSGTLVNQQKLENNDGYVYTIQIEGNIGPMLGDRRVSAKISSTITGFKIPKYMLLQRDGVKYVVTSAGEQVPVLVVSDEGDKVLVQTYKDQATLRAGELIKK